MLSSKPQERVQRRLDPELLDDGDDSVRGGTTPPDNPHPLPRS